MDFQEHVQNLILSNFQALYIATTEEDRCEAELEAVGKRIGTSLNQPPLPLVTWDSVDGFSYLPAGKSKNNILDPLEAIISLRGEIQIDSKGNMKHNPSMLWGSFSGIFVFRDLHEYLKEGTIRRALRNLVEKNKASCDFYRRPLVALCSIQDIPQSVAHCFTNVKFQPPSESRLVEIFDSLQSSITKPEAARCSTDLKLRAVQAMKGLREKEAEDTLAYAVRCCRGFSGVVSNGNNSRDLVEIIEEQKAQALERSEVLTYVSKDRIIAEGEITGYAALEEWVKLRCQAFTPRARELKIDKPRGVILLGVPGTGKTTVGKLIARILKLPLIVFKVARVSASLLGESQRRMEEALTTVDTIDGSVLLVDDADKLFSGVTGVNQSDSTRQQTFQQFLTWLTDHTSMTLVVMTMNRTDGVPPEFLRRGRFDEIFTVGLPDDSLRREILNIHLKKRGVNIKFSEVDYMDFEDLTAGFIGAEIEQAVIDARFNALASRNSGNPTMAELLAAAKNIVPLSVAERETVEQMEKVCTEKGRPVAGNPQNDNVEIPSLARKNARQVLTS